jgi:ABC-type proline/glycine betaine transport system substrate-binding protein
LAVQEQPTLKAIYDSYSINGQVVAQEFKGDEQRSRQAGNNARMQANAAHAAEDARSAAFQAHMDNIDRFSKSFQNIQLDQTEIQDNEQHTRGAVPNALADAWVKANPDRYQTVPSQDFLKGTDF